MTAATSTKMEIILEVNTQSVSMDIPPLTSVWQVPGTTECLLGYVERMFMPCSVITRKRMIVTTAMELVKLVQL